MALILILDDRATNRNIYARLAAAIEPGIVVEVFADPLDALEWLQSNRVDLVITDYRMPGMDGAEFTRRFRTMPDGALVPVLVVTAYDDRSFRMRALDAGATDFLQTPIDHFELVTRARNLLALGRQAALPVGLTPAAQDLLQRAFDGAPPSVLADQSLGLSPALPAQDLDHILGSLPALVSLTDRAGICRYANAALAAWTGRPTTQLVGRPVAMFRPPERAAHTRQEDVAVFETGRALIVRQEEAMGPDGRQRSLLTIKAPLRNTADAITAILTIAFELPGASVHHAANPDAPNPGASSPGGAADG